MKGEGKGRNKEGKESVDELRKRRSLAEMELLPRAGIPTRATTSFSSTPWRKVESRTKSLWREGFKRGRQDEEDKEERRSERKFEGKGKDHEFRASKKTFHK